MGQRSQIYVSYSVGHRNDEGKLDEKSYGKNLIPLYFQWNYGSRMVSRARGLVEWLEDYKPYILPNETDKKIRRIAETNFDMRDVVFSADLIQEYVEDNRELPVGEALCDIFEKQGNNDGKFFLSLEDDGSFKYAFTDREITKPMTAEQYMEWGDYEDEEPESNLKENLEYLENNKNLKLMTEKELHAFINTPYLNVEEEIMAIEASTSLSVTEKEIIAGLKNCKWKKAKESYVGKKTVDRVRLDLTECPAEYLEACKEIFYKENYRHNWKGEFGISAYMSFYKSAEDELFITDKPYVSIELCKGEYSIPCVKNILVSPDGNKDIYEAFKDYVGKAKEIVANFIAKEKQGKELGEK